MPTAGLRGKRPPRRPPYAVPRLADLLVDSLPNPTASFNYASNPHMAGNDQWGDCVPAGWCNLAESASAAFPGAYTYPGDGAVVDFYKQATGSDSPPGPGMLLTDMIQSGLAPGGALGMQLAGWATIDPRDQALVVQAAYSFFCCYSGFALPQNMEEEFVTDGYLHLVSPPEQPEDGHCMVECGYGHVETSRGLKPDAQVETWGTSLPMTYNFGRAYRDECHVLIPTWMEEAGHDALGAMDWSQMQAAMAQLAQAR